MPRAEVDGWMSRVIEHNRNTRPPLSWRDSKEDEAVVTSSALGGWVISARNANLKLWNMEAWSQTVNVRKEELSLGHICPDGKILSASKNC